MKADDDDSLVSVPLLMRRKSLVRWIKVIVLCYALLGIVAYALQDLIFFPAEALPTDHAYSFSIPHEEISVPYDEGSAVSIVRFTCQAPRKGVIVYLHGNRRNISHYARHAPFFTRSGYEVWMVDYPGYGKSTGPLEERLFFEYARQLYLRARKECGADSIVIYGRSLGTAVAAWLATHEQASRLILETPYYSLPSLAASHLPIFPWESVLRFQLNTGDYLRRVTIPVTVFHGTEDGVVPLRNAVLLKPLLKSGDDFVTVSGGSHNDLEAHQAYRQRMDTLLSGIDQ